MVDKEIAIEDLDMEKNCDDGEVSKRETRKDYTIGLVSVDGVGLLICGSVCS